jgi:hypothetical protein
MAAITGEHAMGTTKPARSTTQIAKNWVAKLSPEEKAEIRSVGNADDWSVELVRSEDLDDEALEAVLTEIERQVLRQ